MRFSATILFLSLLTLPFSTCFLVLKILSTAQQILDLAVSVSDTWEVVNGFGNFVDTPLDEKERILMLKLDNINVKLEDLDQKLGSIKTEIEAISRTLRNIPNQINYGNLEHEIFTYGSFISDSYDYMKKYVANIEDYERSTLIDFSNAVVSHRDNSVLKLLNKIYRIIVLQPTFLRLLGQYLEQSNKDYLCLEESPQQTLYNILEKILMINFKGYLTMQSAYMIKKMYGEGNFTNEAKDATQEFKSRTNAFVLTIKSYMFAGSTEMWKCDPEQHIRDKTYVEITGLLQGYILNQVNLEAKGECKASCESYKFTKTHECKRNKWCLQQKPECPKIVNCHSIDDEVSVCKADLSSGRRYNYVEQESGRIYGQKTRCSKRNLFDLTAYRNWVVWKCKYCFCLCDFGEKNRYSDRYINLRLSVADIRNNRVVTGLRFVKHNRIIHLQIQEGKLLPGGQIDSNTVQWVPPENYTILDRNIFEGQDYHVLTWENRGIDLTTIMADQGSIVTGVRFRRFGTRIDLEVLTTPFNFTAGELISDPTSRSIFKNNVYSFKKKFSGELKLDKPDIPIRSTKPSIPNRKTNKYIRFVNSDFDKDAAQSTVPFFDAQPVEPLITVPLSGVGIYYKGGRGSGGFIAPKIFTYDFSQHLDPVFRLEKKN